GPSTLGPAAHRPGRRGGPSRTGSEADHTFKAAASHLPGGIGARVALAPTSPRGAACTQPPAWPGREVHVVGQLGRNLVDETRFDPALVAAAVHTPLAGPAQGQMSAGASHADVTQAPFLFFLSLFQRPHMGKHA